MTIGFIINHLWQSSCFALLAGLLACVLRKNSPKVRYWVWLSASLKFLAPFALLMNLGSFIPQPVQHPISVPVPIVPDLVQLAEPFSTPANATVPASTPWHWVPAAIGIVWAVGFFAIALARRRSWLRIRAALRASTPVPLPIPVPALVSSIAAEPGVVGILRPVLLLPAQLLERLNPQQLGAILTHEMCHVRRRDNFFAAVHMAVEAIFWFNPLVWWIGSRMVEERELACDEEVLRMGCEPADYVEGILKVCRLAKGSLLPCVSGVTGADVKRRLRAVLTGRIALELTLGKRAVLAAAGLASLAAPILVGVLKTPVLEAQSNSAALSKWEAVSVRPCEPGAVSPGGRSGGVGVSPQRLHVTCFPLSFLISATYAFANDRNKLVLQVPPNGVLPVSGGPAWMQSERYDIEAKAEGNPTAREMQGPMLRALLEDRFKLKVHLEAREGPVYELTVVKSGFKLQPMKEGSCIPLDLLNLQTKMMADPKATLAEFANACHNGGIQRGSPMWTAEFHGTDLDEVARWLTRGLDRPVVNKTGISGLFHFQFAFSPDPSAPGYVPSDDPPGGPSIFAAIQTAAGLKLEPTKGLVQHIVVDSAERPSEN